MDDDLPFGFSFPDLPKGKRVTPDEAEVLLQSRMREKRTEFENAVWQVARFYSLNNQQESAAKYISFLMGLTDDPERQAAHWLALGQIMEHVNNFQEAVKYYKRAFGMEPTQSDTWYFINNNLGYSLIQLNEYDEAEPYCRAAIELAPRKPNAYKNLGLALQGQARFAEAAKAYVLAVRANSADPRALHLLEALLEKRPQVTSEVPGISLLLQKSRDAVALATRVTEGAIKAQQDGSQDLTHAEKILVAANRIVFIEGRPEFSRDDIRRALGLSTEEWMSAYTSIFQAMRVDQPGGAPSIDKKYRAVFRQVRHGVHTLTAHGYRVVQKIHDSLGQSG
jgi:tetratricopeptide (TPR) repeat protein